MVAPAQTARICSTDSGNSPPENGKLVVLQGVELSLMFVEALQFDHKSQEMT